MMGKFKDLTGWIMKERGVPNSKLSVIKYSHKTKDSRTYWVCLCECGKTTVVRSDSLQSGRIVSCGRCANKYMFDRDVAIGIDSNNNRFIIDINDYHKAKDYTWFMYNDGYFSRINKKVVLLHRLITNCPTDLVVDHINHDKSDNRMENLRVCTHRQNSLNKRCNGIRLDRRRGTWQAYVYIDGLFHSLGSFKNKEDAIAARRLGEEKYYKEFRYDYNKNKEII